MSKVIYAATPFRLSYQTGPICNFIEARGHFPFHPLLAFPYDRFNEERHDASTLTRLCLNMIDLSDELWIFGIDDISLRDYQHAQQRNKPIFSFVKMFDKDWKRRIRYLKNPDKNILQKILDSSSCGEVPVHDFSNQKLLKSPGTEALARALVKSIQKTSERYAGKLEDRMI